MKKIVIAMDSFKGSLSAGEVVDVVAESFEELFPEAEIRRIPVSDGGEGVLSVLMERYGGSYRTVEVCDPLQRPMKASYGLLDDGQTALIEMAAASGLTLVPEEKRNPLYTTSYGTGQLIADALDQGCSTCIIGLGGSATNDAAIGMLQALGFKFLDREGSELSVGRGELLPLVFDVDASQVHPGVYRTRFIIITDVRNPFYGPEGAAQVFASQKGANERNVGFLDDGLKHFAEVVCRKTGDNLMNVPGSGAAGGAGGGLLAFLKAELRPGIDFILEALDVPSQLLGADLVVTGEGKADRQTGMGKVAYGVLCAAQKQQIPVILLAGGVADRIALFDMGFEAVFSSTPYPMSLSEAMNPSTAKKNLKETAASVARLIRLAEQSKES